MDRRTLIRRVALVGTVGLAGCSSGDDPATTETEGVDDGTTESMATDDPTTTEMTDTTTEEETTEATTEPTTEPTEETSETTTTEPTAEPTESGPQESVTVTVGVDGRARYSPESFTLVQGGEVTFEWAAGGHNVIPDSVPSGGSFEGSPGGKSETQPAGFSYAETFDTPGEYTYYCSVHRSIGMEGSFTVE